MNDDHFTPEEEQLISLLQNAAQPRLKSGISEAIHQMILAEMDKPAQVQPLRPTRLPIRVIASIAAAAVLVFVALFLIQRNTDSVVINPSPETVIAQNSTATPTVQPSNTPVEATSTPKPVPPTVTATNIIATPTLETVFAIEGVIQSVDENILTINGIEIEVPADHPVLKLIDAGDTVRIQGNLIENGVIIASVIDNIMDSGVVDATVTLDGPVAVIDGVLVTVNDILVLFEEDDPVLQRLKIGDFVSIQGNFETVDNRIVLVVVKVSIIADVNPGAPSDCWWHDDAMGMGHWHCDGMGMGGMGMQSSP